MTIRAIRIAKSDRNVDVDFEALPAVSREYIIKYGLTQALNDAAAPINAKDANCAANAWALVQKRVEKLMAGTIGMRESDPVRAEAMNLARRALSAKGFEGTAAELTTKASELVDANPVWMEKAKARVAEAAAMADLLGDIEV